MENKKNREKRQRYNIRARKTIEKQERLGRTKNHSKKKMKKRTTIVDRYIKQVDVYLRINEKKYSSVSVY